MATTQLMMVQQIHLTGCFGPLHVFPLKTPPVIDLYQLMHRPSLPSLHQSSGGHLGCHSLQCLALSNRTKNRTHTIPLRMYFFWKENEDCFKNYSINFSVKESLILKRWWKKTGGGFFSPVRLCCSIFPKSTIFVNVDALGAKMTDI